jgi:GTP-binding protein
LSRLPVVVVVGRPNVGKSTLFNRLTRSRRALVHDLPGVTRDRIFGEADRPGGGAVTLVDTGGLLMEDEDTFIPLIRGQAEAAIRDGDVVIFLLSVFLSFPWSTKGTAKESSSSRTSSTGSASGIRS